jgi:hypothetical protein
VRGSIRLAAQCRRVPVNSDVRPRENRMGTEANLLRDVVHELLEIARRTRASHDGPRDAGDEDHAFESGRLLGIVEAVSLLQQQLRSFQLDPTDYGFPPNFDPERDLLA